MVPTVPQERARARVRHAVAIPLRAALLRPGRVRRIPFGLARGLRLEADPQAPLQVYLGTAEIELAGHIRRLARPGYRCFDVGGYNAYYALALARRTGAAVASFESDPVAVRRMERNLRLNPAVSGRISIWRAHVAHERDERTGADTLDRMISEAGLFIPQFVKIDVEWAELAVLAGARRLLEEHRPHVVVETHTAELERGCMALLREVGYHPTVVPQRRWLKEARPSAHNQWLVAEGRPPLGS